MTISSELIARAKRPELRRLWDELWRRLGGSSRPVVRVYLEGLAGDERVALSELLGLDRVVDASVRVKTADIAAGLRISASELPALTEAIGGPLPDRSAERAARKRERDELWQWFRQRVAGWPLEPWISRLRAGGITSADTASFRRRLEGIARVLDALPADGVVLSVLARTAVADPHGLDWGQWTTKWVLSALAAREDSQIPANAEEARSLWDSVGIVADKHSVGVTTLGLRPLGGDPLAEALGAMHEHAEPTVVTLAQLQRWPVRVPASNIYLFENASVLSHAAQRPWAGPPLISTAGWPNTAVFVLCRQLRASGCRLFHHGDFDPSGISITGYLAARAGVTPWRMAATDYLELARRSESRFSGDVGGTPWNPPLADEMRAWRRAAYEEDVVESLLAQIEDELVVAGAAAGNDDAEEEHSADHRGDEDQRTGRGGTDRG